MPLVMLYNGYSFSVKSDRFQGYNGFEGGVNNQKVWEWIRSKIRIWNYNAGAGASPARGI